MLRRTVPLVLTSLIAVFFLANFFLNIGGTPLERLMLSWTVVILTAAMGLGIINLISYHMKKIQKKRPGEWYYSVALLVGLIFAVAVGLGYGAGSKQFNLLYESSIAPLSATMMSLFIVWLAPGFTRAIRLKNVTSVVILVALVLVVLGSSPVGQLIPILSDMSSWINTVPNKAAQRGLAITIAMGLMIMAARLIIGKEKTYLREIGA